jgi:hypothetical protein
MKQNKVQNIPLKKPKHFVHGFKKLEKTISENEIFSNLNETPSVEALQQMIDDAVSVQMQIAINRHT